MWFAGGCESPLGRRRTIDEPAKATLFDPQVSGGEGGAADSLFDMAVDASRVHLSRRSTTGENAKRSDACVLDDYGWGRRPLSGRHSSGGCKRPRERRHRCELSDACVVAVGPSDHGTHLDIAQKRVVLSGSSPDAFECARSIDVRRTWNDWRVRDFETVGLFVFEPAFAFRTMSEDVVIEVPVRMETIIAEFPADRIFSIRN